LTLRIDWGYGFDRLPWSDQKQWTSVTTFTIGQQFNKFISAKFWLIYAKFELLNRLELNPKLETKHKHGIKSLNNSIFFAAS